MHEMVESIHARQQFDFGSAVGTFAGHTTNVFVVLWRFASCMLQYV